MKPKYQVLIYNFIGFALLFVLFRFGLNLIFQLESFYMALIAALLASVLAPKFAVVKNAGSHKILMKWIFVKGFKEL